MNIITLISDWKLRDPYVAMFKGQILKTIPDAQIIDITHTIDLFDFGQTAFIMKSVYGSFPEGTAHVILTGSTLSHEALPVVVKYDNHFFIGEDTGVFSLMFDDLKGIESSQYSINDKKLTVLDKCVCLISNVLSGKMKDVVEPYPQFVQKLSMKPDYDQNKNCITGSICYIDTCCNAVTNIPTEMFLEYSKNHSICVTVSSTKHLKITRYHDFYDPNENEVYILSNRLGFIELSIKSGRLAVLADLKIGDSVSIQML